MIDIFKIHFYGGNYQNMYKIIPPSNFPSDYGGEGPSTDELIVEWKKKLESYRDFFLEDSKFGCDESKRPITSKNSKTSK